MDRRKFIASACASLTLISGCTGILSSDGSDSREIGDTVTYEGVEFTPAEYLLANEIDLNYSMNTSTETAGDGAVFLLTKVNVIHKGDSAQAFPPFDSLENIYDGETTFTGITLSDAASSYTVDGVDLQRYQAPQGDAYPGDEASGWMFTKVASNFDPSKLELQVTWNQQLIGDEGETTHTWTYTSDVEVSVEDVDDNSTTVTIG